MRRRFANCREMGRSIVMAGQAGCRCFVMNKDCRLPCHYSVAGVAITCCREMPVALACRNRVVMAGEAVAAEIGMIRSAVGRNPCVRCVAIGAGRCRFNVANLFWNSRRMGSIMTGLARCGGLAVIERCRRPGSSRGRVAGFAIV